MSERQRHDQEPCWPLDVLLGEGIFSGEAKTIRLKARITHERYRHSDERDEIVPLRTKAGTRTYIHAQPYILEPDITLTVGLYPSRRPDGAIGEVLRSEWEGLRHVPIGNAQAWLYRPDRTLIIWEAFLHDRHRQPDPTADLALKMLWTGLEHLLLTRFTGVQRIATPSWEPIYDQQLWQQFLGSLGFVRWNQRAFGKGVRRR